MDRPKSPLLTAALLVGAVALLALLAWGVSSLRTRSAPESEAAPPAAEVLTVYSGRNEKLIGELIERFERETGIRVQVRYGETAQLAALLLEEGPRSPADVFIAQDAGALGALARSESLAPLPEPILARVPDERFRSPDGVWVGLSGRARVLAYNTQRVKPEELPRKVQALTDPSWKGRLGWAPGNASFQAFVTALRLLQGEEAAVAWLRGVQSNQPRKYKNNTAIIEALARGEIDVGLVNHYYVFAAAKDRPEALPVQNHYFEQGDPGALVNVAGAGILRTSRQPALAERFVQYLLGESAQRYFTERTFEYPVVADIDPHEKVGRTLAEIGAPKLDLSKLEDLQGTVRLLQREGVL